AVLAGDAAAEDESAGKCVRRQTEIRAWRGFPPLMRLSPTATEQALSRLRQPRLGRQAPAEDLHLGDPPAESLTSRRAGAVWAGGRCERPGGRGGRCGGSAALRARSRRAARARRNPEGVRVRRPRPPATHP